MLTRKQKLRLDFIKAYMDKNFISPSYDEIMNGIGLKSKSGVHRLIYALQERGFIEIRPDRARAVTLVDRCAPHDKSAMACLIGTLCAIVAGHNEPKELAADALRRLGI